MYNGEHILKIAGKLQFFSQFHFCGIILDYRWILPSVYDLKKSINWCYLRQNIKFHVILIQGRGKKKIKSCIVKMITKLSLIIIMRKKKGSKL